MLKSLLSLVGALGTLAGSSTLGTYLSSKGSASPQQTSTLSPLFVPAEEAASIPEAEEVSEVPVVEAPTSLPEVTPSVAKESKETIYLTPRTLDWRFKNKGYRMKTNFVMAADEFAQRAGMDFRTKFLEVSGLSSHRDHTADILESACKNFSRYSDIDPKITTSLRRTIEIFCYDKVGHRLG